MSLKELLPGLLLAFLSLTASSSASITPAGSARPANADGRYAALRGLAWAGEGITVKDVTLEREGATIHLEAGRVFFYGIVQGRATGALFLGKGTFHYTPEQQSEQHSLAFLTKSSSLDHEFTQLALRFTDGTAEELKKASTGSAGVPTGEAQGVGIHLTETLRRKLHENLELEMLEDVKSGTPGGIFLASFPMRIRLTERNVLFMVDPRGTPNAAPDEVELSTWNDEGVETWVAARMHAGARLAGAGVHVTDQLLDVSFEKNGAMRCTAETTLTVRRDGTTVIPLQLYRMLRVAGVYDEAGKPLDYIRESRDDDPEFAVVLPAPAKAGQVVHLLIQYGGSDTLRREGESTFYLVPGARESWYPAGYEALGGFANYRMTFHLPRGLQIVATGKRVSQDGTVSTWATDAPIAVAGFNVGDFKTKGVKTPDGFAVDAYANTTVPDWATPLLGAQAVGTLSTVASLPDEVAQGSAAIQLYTDYFGKLPYDHVALTQQTACNYGQSWPMLVYLPVCGFWDSTIRHQLGLDQQDRSYWDEVTPHEVSHQWWGQMVGFNSYRDQWMSEGFAHFSVGVYLMGTSKKMDDYRNFWEEQRKRLFEKNAQGMRAVDVGPVTMGVRVANDKAGYDVYQRLIYSKGAYIVHMLELMYWTPQTGSAQFKRAMQRFVKEYNGKAATTEDFKASLEEDLPRWLNLDGNGKLDWFFNEYVYGTEVPRYTISSEFTVVDGETTVHMKVTQANVSDKFAISIPLYVQMQNGETARVANLTMRGNKTLDTNIKLGKMPSPGKKLVLNYNHDVLSD